MSSYIDIALHLFFSILAGFLVWKLYGGSRKDLVISIICAFIAGVLIDLDHFIDNFLSFGWDFNFDYFIRGEYFIRSGNYFIFFHGFEYVLILLAIFKFFIKTKISKMIILSFAFSMFIHLMIDILFFSVPVINYSILYRFLTGFTGYKGS